MRLTLACDFSKHRKCSSLTGKDLKLLQKRSEIIKLDEEIRSHLSVASALWEMRPNWGFIKEAEKIGASENKESGQLCSQ